MLFHPNYAVFDRVLPASAYQQQADMPWWVWVLIIVVVIFLFVLLWRRFGLSKGGEQPTAKPAVQAKPIAPVTPSTWGEKKSQPEAASAATPIVGEESTLIAKKPEVVPGTPDKPDDLAMLEGIGPKIASVLQGVGIKTFAQLAHTNIAILEDTLKAAGIRLADPASWPEQAKLAAEGKMDELKTLQDTLKGGRRA